MVYIPAVGQDEEVFNLPQPYVHSRVYGALRSASCEVLRSAVCCSEAGVERLKVTH